MHVPALDRAGVIGVAACLRAAQPAWAARSVEERAAVLLEWADRIVAEGSAIAAAEAVDMGISRDRPPIAQIAAGSIRGWCASAPSVIAAARVSGASSTMPGVRYQAELVPYALVGAITPWNMPLMMSLIDIVPALLAGSAVMVKPSEIAPRFIAPLQNTIAAVPALAEVLAYITGDGATGAAIVDEVDVICFTGSIATGKRVAARAAERMVPAYLELGGKDPAIVAASADVEHAAARVLAGATANTGQLCFSIERVYVDAAIYPDFMAALRNLAETVPLAHPQPDSTGLGPFISAEQGRIVERQIADAVAKGARVESGGDLLNLDGGLYMRPTILSGVTHDMAVVQEETFGPVIPVMSFDTIDEAVARANDSEFGLSAAVFAGTEDEAAAIARRLHAGTISLQDTCLNLARSRDVASNPFGNSGLGATRSGPMAITRFMRSVAILAPAERPTKLTHSH